MSRLFSQFRTNTAADSKKNTATADSPRRSASVFLIIALGILLLFLTVRLFGISPADLLLSEDKKFQKFTEEVFRSEMSGNTLNLHYTVAEPSSFHINKEEITLGDASLASRKKACATTENYLNTLKKFDYEKLSPKHQLTRDIFLDYLTTELEGADYLLYDEPLSPTLGIQAQLPVLLAEYTFRTKGDIEDYLALLSQIPDYFSSILSFERDKANAGLFMSRACAADVVGQCEEFIENPEQNYLIEIFNEKIDEISNLTADEKISYKNRNKSILEGYVIPAYQNLSAGIAALAGAGKNDKGLYYYPEGTEYYRYLVKSTVGDKRSIEEIEEAVKTQMVEDFTAIQKLAAQLPQTSAGSTSESGADSSVTPDAASDSTAPDTAASLISPTTATVSSASPAALLTQLQQKITADFPLLPKVSCNVKYVHKSLQKYLSPAFYLTPAIDDYENNVIYINPSSNYDTLELFTTLAHEGYPGHLYQSVYFNAQEPDLLRSILDVGGYTEGWATYVEMYAYSLWDEDPSYAALCQRNRSFTLGLASLLDIGIHYRGYTLEEVTAFLQKLGFGTETAKSLYNSILQSPANYLQYYVGCLNFYDLRDDVKAVQKEQFSLKEFHRLVLETGPAPFDILRKQLSRSISARG